MTADKHDGRYQIELELAELHAFRMVTATLFSEAARALHHAKQGRASGWRLRGLRRNAEEARRDYELACAAVVAAEQHHFDAGALAGLRNYMDSFANDRLVRHRSHADDDTSVRRLLSELLFELRGLRDGVAPPKADAMDVRAAREVVSKNRE